MKEIALMGMNCRVFADTLSALLHRDINVNAMVPFPERVMLDDVKLTVTRLYVDNPEALKDELEGYHDVVMAFDDDQTDVEANDFALRYYKQMVNAARLAGVARLIVVGSPEASAYFMGGLRRIDGIDWVFISTENDYPGRVADEVEHPHYHREEYVA